MLARAKKCSTKTQRVITSAENEGALIRKKLEVSQVVSTDQFICKTLGRLPSDYGRESRDQRYQGGTIYNDAATGLIWVENQVSLWSNETVMGKLRFEQ